MLPSLAVRTSIDERLATIGKRLAALPERDPRRRIAGAAPPAGHDWTLGKTVSERALREVEKRHQVELPAGYRGFLRSVGDGGAGPGLGLWTLARALSKQRRLKKPFPFGHDDARRILELARSKQDPQATIGTAELAPGVLRLGDEGSAGHSVLVVSGAQRGKVWALDARGYRPRFFARGEALVQHTFLSWYEAWLRRAWSDSAPLSAPPGDRWNLTGKLRGELPETVFAQTHLVDLALAANKLTEIPAGIGRLSRLRKLGLSSNLLDSLPDEIGALTQLEELDLSGNRLSELPRGVCTLSALRVLDLSRNPLRELPDTMGALRSLRRLALGDTPLRRLPRTLGSLPLEELQLNGVRLEDWRDLKLLASGGTLKNLWLSMNPGLEVIPDPVFDLASLEYLVLGATPIREIPTDIALLENLRTLGLSGTRVRALPPVLGELRALKRVALQNAPVPPEELARARQLWPHIEFEA